MGDFFGIFGNNDNENMNDKESMNDNEKETTDEGRLQLRQEKLDITKNKEKAGEVILSKEIVEEQQSVDVPVTREEVVIERRTLDNEPCDSPITSGEIIHIPVSKEHVNVDKHTVVTGEISAHKQEIEEKRHVDETLKREEAKIDTEGDSDVIKDESGFRG